MLLDWYWRRVGPYLSGGIGPFFYQRTARVEQLEMLGLAPDLFSSEVDSVVSVSGLDEDEDIPF